MSEIKRINLNGREFMFVNESKSTRNGFAHLTQLFNGDCLVSYASCNYLNRTWECYTYQSVMQKAVRKLLDNIEEITTERYKRENNISRLTEKRREEIKKIYLEDSNYKMYSNLLEAL